MTEKEKAKAYDEAIERTKKLYGNGIAEEIFTEHKESKDNKIREAILKGLIDCRDAPDLGWSNFGGIPIDDCIDWLERQNKKSSWKPSKEEMDVLYSLSYITNEYDEHKEDVITHLYQDLKREFFNGSSYENMFSLDNKEDDVRRRSTIQVLEYARSLDAYNQYGKADIDKNIAWLEKQGEQKPTLPKWKYKKDNTPLLRDSIILNKYGGVAKSPSGAIISDVWVLDYDELAKLPKEKKNEPKFKVGDWVVFITSESVYQVEKKENYGYTLRHILGGSLYVSFSNEKLIREWTIQDAKDRDVLCCKSGWMCIFKAIDNHTNTFSSYCFMDSDKCFFSSGSDGHTLDKIFIKAYNGEINPATKEQRDTLMKAMNDAGYEWDEKKKELKKLVKY